MYIDLLYTYQPDVYFQSVNIHVGKNADQMRGYINNKQQGWSFPVDAVSYMYMYLPCTLPFKVLPFLDLYYYTVYVHVHV